MRLPIATIAIAVLLGLPKTQENTSTTTSAPDGMVTLECSFMIDFPGETGAEYMAMDERVIRRGIDHIGEHGLVKTMNSRCYHRAQVPATNGVADPVFVRGELDRMIGKFNRLTEAAVEFDRLKPDKIGDFFEGTPYFNDPHYVTLPNERQRELELESGVAVPEPEISCVRFIWRDGKLIAIYNYVATAVNPAHEPDAIKIPGEQNPVFGVTLPTYCAVAEFVVEY